MSIFMVSTTEAAGQGIDQYFSTWYSHSALWKGNCVPAGFKWEQDSMCAQLDPEESRGPQATLKEQIGTWWAAHG